MEQPGDARGGVPPGYDDDGDDGLGGDEKQKVSRWQIGSSSLGVLEQVYSTEPFPGARAISAYYLLQYFLWRAPRAHDGRGGETRRGATPPACRAA